MYSSPKKSGWRVFPVVWHKNMIENDKSYTSTYTPLFFDKHTSDTAKDSTSYRLNFSPLHFYKYNELNNTKSELWFSSIPVIFYKYNERTRRYSADQPDETKDLKADNSEPGKFTGYKTSDTMHWLFPLYCVCRNDMDDEETGITTSDYTMIGLPLLYYHYETEKNRNTGGKKKKQGSLFFMGYYKQFSSELNSSNILFGLYSSENYPSTGGYSYSMLYGLFNISDIKGNYKNYFHPFYYYANDNGKFEKSVLLGLWRSKENITTGDSSTKLLYSLFSTSVYHHSIMQRGISIPVEESDTWLFPFFENNKIDSADAGKTYSKHESYSLLHYRESFKQSSDESYTFWAPIIPLFYFNSDKDSSHTNILWIADYEKNRTSDYTRFWLLPVIFSKTGDYGYFHIAPLYFSTWDKKADDNTHIICGLYLHDMPGYSRKNFLYLYDHISENYGKNNDYSFLFSTVEYQVDPEIKKIRALWGLLADAGWNRQRYDIEGFAYLAAIESEKGYFHSRILPVWYYESTENSHTLVIPPVLTWDSSDSDRRKFQMWALGALWFRNYKPDMQSDLQAALLGIPYYKYQTAERGYESRGSLWGLLWEYETEKETGFTKLSLLKFVYKRVEIDGEVTHKVLGISF